MREEALRDADAADREISAGAIAVRCMACQSPSRI
jgi:hypothetical protein